MIGISPAMQVSRRKTKPDNKQAPLHGVRVLDLTRVLAGPWCTMTLGDLGAEVLKVEHPKGGDDTRGWGPFNAQGESAYFLGNNRNKKCLAIDIARPRGQELVRKLVAVSDVLVENFRVGALDKYGLGYEDLHILNPGLIYCSITGFGHRSSLADRPGYDFVAQAEGGIMSITGEPDGEPVRVGVPITDVMTGMNATQSILAALLQRERTGQGQHLDIALMDAVVTALSNPAHEYLTSGIATKRIGNSHPSIVPYEAFKAADGYFVLAVGSDKQFDSLCRNVIARPELAADPRYSTNGARLKNRSSLRDELRAAFATRTVADWAVRLGAYGVPCGLIRSIPEVLKAPEVLERNLVINIPMPDGRSVRVLGSPLKMGDANLPSPTAPGRLGEHTQAVLSQLTGITATEFRELLDAGVVAAPPRLQTEVAQ